MKWYLSIIAAALYMSCTPPRKAGMATPISYGDTRTNEVGLIDDHTYRLTYQSTDKTYAYEMNNPVKVGGFDVLNEKRYLNALLGPHGEPTTYHRIGSCCSFETPNGKIGGMGLLDHYEITWQGNNEPLKIYINVYDTGNLEIPVGLTAKK